MFCLVFLRWGFSVLLWSRPGTSNGDQVGLELTYGEFCLPRAGIKGLGILLFRKKGEVMGNLCQPVTFKRLDQVRA